MQMELQKQEMNTIGANDQVGAYFSWENPVGRGANTEKNNSIKEVISKEKDILKEKEKRMFDIEYVCMSKDLGKSDLHAVEDFGRKMMEVNDREFELLSKLQFLTGKQEKIYDAIEENMYQNTKILKIGNTVRILLPFLLPKRLKPNAKNWFIERNRIYVTYAKAVAEWFKQNLRYETKVVVCFIFHYKDEAFMKDHDNVDVKIFIDAIASYGLADDNPKWCAHFMDYVLDKADYTEIRIVPEDEFWAKGKDALFPKRDKA